MKEEEIYNKILESVSEDLKRILVLDDVMFDIEEPLFELRRSNTSVTMKEAIVYKQQQEDCIKWKKEREARIASIINKIPKNIWIEVPIKIDGEESIYNIRQSSDTDDVKFFDYD